MKRLLPILLLIVGCLTLRSDSVVVGFGAPSCSGPSSLLPGLAHAQWLDGALVLRETWIAPDYSHGMMAPQPPMPMPGPAPAPRPIQSAELRREHREDIDVRLASFSIQQAAEPDEVDDGSNYYGPKPAPWLRERAFASNAVRVTTVGGKSIAGNQLAATFADEIVVIVNESGKEIDPRFLRSYRSAALIVHLPPPPPPSVYPAAPPVPAPSRKPASITPSP